jgi:hypothetical protein
MAQLTHAAGPQHQVARARAGRGTLQAREHRNPNTDVALQRLEGRLQNASCL